MSATTTQEQEVVELEDQLYQAACFGSSEFTFHILACRSDSLFLGCCSDLYGCADGRSNGSIENFTLEPHFANDSAAGAIPSFKGGVHQQSCLPGSRSQWYACTSDSDFIGFFGCCQTDPCNDLCPSVNLSPAFLSPNADLANFFYGLNTTSVTYSASSLTSTVFSAGITTSITTPTSAQRLSTSSTGTTCSLAELCLSGSVSSSTSAPPVLKTVPDANTSVVVGSAVGGVAGFALIIAFVAFLLRRRNRTRVTQLNTSGAPSLRFSGQGEGVREVTHNSIAEAPSSDVSQKPHEVIGTSN